MSDSIQLASGMKASGSTDQHGSRVLDAWSYRELDLELQVFHVDGPAGATATWSLETASTMEEQEPTVWHSLGCFAPMGEAGSDRRRFGRLLRFVRWRLQTSSNTVGVVFSIQGMAR